MCRGDGDQLMRALLSTEPGDGSRLRIGELPLPEPGPGEVRIRSHFAGLNYPDALIIEDRYQISPPRPFAPGIEVAGIVDEVGPGGVREQVGQPCVALVRYGGLADYVVAPACTIAPLPAGMDAATAASMAVSYGTSWHALHDRGKLQAGETLLVLGSSGTVGSAAVQIGKAVGARVVAAVSSEEKARAVRHCADEVVIYPREQVDSRGLAAVFKDVCGSVGATCVFDPVGGVYGEAAFRALAWRGRFLVVGFAAALPAFPANLVLLKSADVLGVSWGEMVSRTPGLFQRHIDEIGALVARGAVRPRPDTVVTLEDAGVIIQSLSERRAFGKAIVNLGTGGSSGRAGG